MKELEEKIVKFAEDRDWLQFVNPRKFKEMYNYIQFEKLKQNSNLCHLFTLKPFNFRSGFVSDDEIKEQYGKISNIFKCDMKFIKPVQTHTNIVKCVDENNMNELVEESENKKYSDSAKQYDTLSKINIYRTNKWRIKIPVLGLDAPISQGTSSEELRRTVGHFEETSKSIGNIGLAAHNRGYEVNYFAQLKKLKQGDEIIYKYYDFEKTYTIVENVIIKDTDWSCLEEKGGNRITLITCVENEPEYRRCVQGIEKDKEGGN